MDYADCTKCRGVPWSIPECTEYVECAEYHRVLRNVRSPMEHPKYDGVCGMLMSSMEYCRVHVVHGSHGVQRVPWSTVEYVEQCGEHRVRGLCKVRGVREACRVSGVR